jgi:hypothetical protein
MSFVPAGDYVSDSNLFAPPHFGGTIAAMHGSFTYQDTAAKTLFTLPKGAVPVFWWLNVTTAFNSSGTDLADLGITGDGDYFANDVDVAAAAWLPPSTSGMDKSRLCAAPLAEDTDVTAQFAQSVADASAGAATFCVFYILMDS